MSTNDQLQGTSGSQRVSLQRIVISLILHLLAIGVLFLVWRPIASWYLSQDPLRGIDLYNNATFVQYIKDHASLPFFDWKYLWYQGSPFGFDYPFFYYYVAAGLTRFTTVLEALQLTALGATFLLGVFSYLLFWELSSHRVVAVILAIGVLFSENIYRVLVWAGGVPYFVSEAILPMTLYALVKYKKTKKLHWLIAASVITSIGMLGHPQPIVFYVIPAGLLLMIVVRDEEQGFFRGIHVKGVLGYLFLTALLSGASLARYFLINIPWFTHSLSVLFGGKQITSYDAQQIEASEETRQWSLSQVGYVWNHTNEILWIAAAVVAGLFLVTFIFQKKKLHALGELFFAALPAIGVIGAVMLYARGYIQFIGGWYKVFWAVPLLIGVFSAWGWGSVSRAISRIKILQHSLLRVARVSGTVIVFFALLVVGYVAHSFYSRDTIQEIQLVSMSSSAYPTALNAKDSTVRDAAVSSVVPSWFPKEENNYRLYEVDATVNIWWNTYFAMPLARGYIDPPTADEGTMFWLNAAIGKSEKANSSLEESWEIPRDVVMNNLLYLLDWQAIKYIEGNHSSQASAAQLNPDLLTPTFLAESGVATVSGTYGQVSDGVYEWRPQGKEDLRFYSLKDEYVTPILSVTNAPSLLIIGDNGAYDTMRRLFAELNLNSQYLVFVRGPKHIDDVDPSDLFQFDMVVLYGYDYHNHGKAWSTIEAYLKKGGSVFIETGQEVKESDSMNLPERFSKDLPGVFPVKNTVRSGMGYAWEGEIPIEEYRKDIDVKNFSPLDFDGEEWRISYPPDGDEDVGEGAEVILRHKGVPVIIRGTNFGGKVVWSGVNFPYHIMRNHNQDELRLFTHVLEWLIPLEKQVPVNTSIVWESPEKRSIQASGAKGVLLK
ncbi:MAG TPA: 6-pyruvoyl-tetrahydropterin synthase-related protein, partial [Patescibacteria group bacterium]|nr:6-pyruvoyl-tetrahydropterin synthase-related protein [Patescibacteria group bacterium]